MSRRPNTEAAVHAAARLASPHVGALVAGVASYAGSIPARRAQASSDAVRRELADLARREDKALIALGTLLGLPRTALESAASGGGPLAAVSTFAAALAPLDQTLLADLAVARSLADRAHLARAALRDDAELADALDDVEQLYRDWATWELEAAAEVAAGGLGRLEPTQVQRAAQRARQVAALPAKAGREVAGTVIDLRDAVADQAREAAADVTARVQSAVAAASEAAERARDEVVATAVHAGRIADAAWTAGRDAALAGAEHEARQEDTQVGQATAALAHEARAELGLLAESELPLAKYDSLSATEIREQVANLTDQQSLRALESYEQAGKGRKTVIAGIRDRSAELVSA